MAKTIRVAAVQFHAGADIDANLATTLRMLDEAAKSEADIIVLPEFCNHLSWYNDKQHCFDVSVALESDFLQAIAAKARALKTYIVVNCTVQRADNKATGSSLMYSPEGELLGDNTKQIYIGHENDFLEKAQTPGPIVTTPIGRFGLYACMDGVINETPRGLALRGAQVLCNSLNSFASDESSLHIPVRAAENRVFVVAANKVGPLVPEEMIGAISAGTGIPEKFLCGAGESQIVSPEGEVLAIASLDQEEVIFADIDVDEADHKCRSDGTNVFSQRRPELYQAIAQDPAGQPRAEGSGVESVEAAVLQSAAKGMNEALEEALQALPELVSEGIGLIALPPLVGAGQAQEDLLAAESFSLRAIDALSAVCGKAYISTALVSRNDAKQLQYCAVLISAEGLVLKQGQIHRSERFAWSALSDSIVTASLSIGNVGLLTTDDTLYPESFRLLAMAQVELAAIALEPLQTWELQTGLLERSAENRINVLAASSDNAMGKSFITSLQKDFTVMTPWEERPFDGLLSQPIWARMEAGESVLRAKIYPSCAENKEVSRNTHLLDNRPWELAQAIVA